MLTPMKRDQAMMFGHCKYVQPLIRPSDIFPMPKTSAPSHPVKLSPLQHKDERRRAVHIRSEQKRRHNMNISLDRARQMLVLDGHDEEQVGKMTKVEVLGEVVRSVRRLEERKAELEYTIMHDLGSYMTMEHNGPTKEWV